MEQQGNTTQGGEQPTEGTPPALNHIYFEVGTDVLSKPNALCDILDVNGCPASAIFCNSPSDADLVDVILKKRGISSIKLVGHVPPMQCSRALKQVKAGEISCLVVTDVSGQTIDVEELDLVINYSLPSAPEDYIHRCGHSRVGQRLTRVISLIGALDIANLHYLKKVGGFDLQKAELPSKEEVSGSALVKLTKQAVETASVNDARIQDLVKQVLADKNKDEIVALLLRNTLDLIPALQANQARGGHSEEGERGYDRNERSEGRGDRWGNRDGGRDGGRGGRGRRGDRGGYGDEGGQPRGDDENGYDNYQSERRGRGGRDRGERGDRDRGDRGERNQTPPEKNARIYLGQGSHHGLNTDKLTGILSEQCKLTPEQVKATKIRTHYSFIDVSDEQADGVLAALNEGEGSRQLFARRAITVNAPRAEMPQQNGSDAGTGEGQMSEEAQGADA